MLIINILDFKCKEGKYSFFVPSVFKYMIIVRTPQFPLLIKLYDLTVEPSSQAHLKTLKVDCFPLGGCQSNILCSAEPFPYS